MLVLYMSRYARDAFQRHGPAVAGAGLGSRLKGVSCGTWRGRSGRIGVFVFGARDEGGFQPDGAGAVHHAVVGRK
jgi:hypothetical protein